MKAKKLLLRILAGALVLGVAAYFGISQFLTLGPESEFTAAGEITELTQRYIEQNTEQFPEFLEGEHAVGKRTFNKWCSHCHSPGGMEHVGTIALEFKYEGSVPPALERRTDLHSILIKTFVRSGVKSMPAFRRTEISNLELEKLANYLARNSTL